MWRKWKYLYFCETVYLQNNMQYMSACTYTKPICTSKRIHSIYIFAYCFVSLRATLKSISFYRLIDIIPLTIYVVQLNDNFDIIKGL
jgi:hypothetical protein